MESLLLDATRNTPYVSFDAVTHQLELKGRSIPEHSSMFYAPLILWIKELAQHHPTEVTLTLKLDYINSSSHKFILDIIEHLEPMQIAGGQVLVKWYYEEEDDEMHEVGEDFEGCVPIPFEHIEVEEFE